MAPTGQPAPLTRESLGHLAYLHRVLTAPPDGAAWPGFYIPQADTMNFGLRFQIAFAAYAVAAAGLRTPAYTRPYVEALGAAIERMRHVRVWGYWRRATPASGGESAEPAGHLAVLLAPHGRAAGPLPPPADPIVQDNVQYSGHFGTLLGLYERAGGDDRYDRPFDLVDPESGVRYAYTHGMVAARLVEQMRANYFHGVACEPSCAYVPCNNHAMTANALHDVTHGTDYAAANADWLAWVRRKMVLRGPAFRGLFGACFLRDAGVAAPVAFQFTDSWGLAFLLPFDRPLVRRLYPRFRARLSTDPAHRLPDGRSARYVGSAPLCERLEISDVALNTGFGRIVACGLGDAATAARLAAYAVAAFDRRWVGDELVYAGAPRTLYSTALYALADLVAGDPALMRTLFRAPRDPALAAGPALDRVASAVPGAAPDALAPGVGVAEAAFARDARELAITLAPLGADPAPDPRPLRLDCLRVPAVRAVTRDGAPWDAWTWDVESGRLTITAPGGAAQRFVVACGG